LDTTRVEELIGSIQIYEPTFPNQKKGTFIELKFVKKKHGYSFDDDFNSEDITLGARKFRKFMFKKKNNGKDKK
jgi:hypothetical protein